MSMCFQPPLNHFLNRQWVSDHHAPSYCSPTSKSFWPWSTIFRQPPLYHFFNTSTCFGPPAIPFFYHLNMFLTSIRPFFCPLHGFLTTTGPFFLPPWQVFDPDQPFLDHHAMFPAPRQPFFLPPRRVSNPAQPILYHLYMFPTPSASFRPKQPLDEFNRFSIKFRSSIYVGKLAEIVGKVFNWVDRFPTSLTIVRPHINGRNQVKNGRTRQKSISLKFWSNLSVRWLCNTVDEFDKIPTLWQSSSWSDQWLRQVWLRIDHRTSWIAGPNDHFQAISRPYFFSSRNRDYRIPPITGSKISNPPIYII